MNLDLDRINATIADRANVFYWQTDRDIEPEEAGEIWADRHRYFSDLELLERVNEVIGKDKLEEIEPLDKDSQTSLGNVNSVRVGKLLTGKEVVIRCHPKGIRNGYFYSETAAAHKAKLANLPTYETLAIHEWEGDDDFAFQIIEKMPGIAIKKWLEQHPSDEQKLLVQMGRTMAQLHQVKVSKFGPFDNVKAKTGELVGIHATLAQSMRAGLSFNLGVLEKSGLLTTVQQKRVSELFEDNNPLLASSQAVLVHNDFADWNLLTDGNSVTGILDWDECVASDPVSDIACWSTFFDPERTHGFLDGYWQLASKPLHFDEKFELFRLRYVISKMTLRIRRYTWEPTEAIRERIEIGKTHLTKSLDYFGI